MTSFFRIIKMGLQDFYRNLWLSIVTISVITFTLLLISSLFVLNITIKTAQQSIQEKMDIAVYLKDPIDVWDEITYNIYAKNTSGNDQKNYTFFYDLSDVLPFFEVKDVGGSEIKDGKIYFKEAIFNNGQEKKYKIKFKVLPRNKWPSETIIPYLKQPNNSSGIEFKVTIFNETKNLDIFSDKDVEKRKMPFWGEITLLMGDRYSLVIKDIKENLLRIENVKEIKYVSKKDALERFKKENFDPKLIEYATIKNPLSASIEIRTKNPEIRNDIENLFKKPEYQAVIKNISWEQEYNKKIAEKLASLTKFLRTFGFGVSVFFIVISLLIIINTVRINLFSRKDTIEIMKLVGASPWFIKGPFLIEALVYGFISSLTSFILFYPILIYSIIPSLDRYISSESISILKYFHSNIFEIFLLQLLTGIFISFFAALFSLNRYFKKY